MVGYCSEKKKKKKNNNFKRRRRIFSFFPEELNDVCMCAEERFAYKLDTIATAASQPSQLVATLTWWY